MTTETTQEAAAVAVTPGMLTEALTGFSVAVRDWQGYQEAGKVAHPESVAGALHATLSRIAAERDLAAEPEESTLGRVLAIIRNVDEWLDAGVSFEYQAAPLGQDWARVAKASEEAGDAIAALIAFTGQNPRKGVCGSLDDLLGELADVACVGMFAIQHFTKDEAKTGAVVMAAMEKAAKRAAAAGYDADRVEAADHAAETEAAL